MPNLIHTKASFDAREEKDHNRLERFFATQVNKSSLPVSPISEKVDLVDEGATHALKVKVVLKVSSDKRVAGKSHNLDRRHCRNKSIVEGLSQSRQMEKGVCSNELVVVDVPTDIDVDVFTANVFSEGKFIANDGSDVRCETEAPAFARPRSSQPI